MIEFGPFADCPPGLFAEMLVQSYSALLDLLPDEKVEELLSDWRAYDTAVFEEPDTVGDCGFVTRLDGEVVGFASWNPLGWPDVGVIGHNCILPAQQGRGYGVLQIEEILRRFTKAGFEKASLHTDSHPFFAPAQRMYERCGFVEAARQPGVLLDGYQMIAYERLLRDSE